MQKPQIRNTADGSDTLYVAAIDECYHSTNGAIQESLHIFINDGFRECKNERVKVLEIGFGTGLNAFLTLLESEKTDKNVNYTGIELYPVDISDALKLNYPELTDKSKISEYQQIHQCAWNEAMQITEKFTLTKLLADFTETPFEEKFDVIYFDAFSPEKQPEMWSENLFKKLYLCAENDAILTTYCAKGAVRRAMQAAGFTVERLPGPIGKREILRARKLKK